MQHYVVILILCAFVSYANMNEQGSVRKEGLRGDTGVWARLKSLFLYGTKSMLLLLWKYDVLIRGPCLCERTGADVHFCMNQRMHEAGHIFWTYGQIFSLQTSCTPLW